MLKGKTILLGVTGGIAVYKAAALCSRLSQAGARVRVVMTESATKFVAPLTFQTLSRHPVYLDTFEERDPSVVSHIDLADSADLIVIAPATANIIAKLAVGMADDMLSTTALAATAPILLCPAMNVHMYDHPAVQANLRTLTERGVRLVEPGEGQLACGYVGKGRLAEPEQIFARIEAHFSANRPLEGKRVLVTAGGTVERIDPVRYLTNDSSGKMGFAIAAQAREMGASVTVIAARTSVEPPAGVEVVRAESAQEMYEAALSRFEDSDLVVMSAAVSDYRPAETADRKIKKNADTLTLTLVKNPDILQAMGERKTHQFLVGFAAETHEMERFAQEKAVKKNCDLVAANDVSRSDAGFGVDTNSLVVFDQAGKAASFGTSGKAAIARELLELAAKRMSEGRRG